MPFNYFSIINIIVIAVFIILIVSVFHIKYYTYNKCVQLLSSGKGEGQGCCCVLEPCSGYLSPWDVVTITVKVSTYRTYIHVDLLTLTCYLLIVHFRISYSVSANVSYLIGL